MPVTFFGGEAGLVAYLTTSGDDLIHSWRSEDGVGWTEEEPLGDDAGEPTLGERMRLESGPDAVEVIDYGGDRGWTSADGLTWGAYDGITWERDDYYDDIPETPTRPVPPEPPMRPDLVAMSEDYDAVTVEFSRIPSGFLSLSADGFTYEGVAPDWAPVHSLLFHLDGQAGSVTVDVTDLGIEMGVNGSSISGWPPNEPWVDLVRAGEVPLDLVGGLDAISSNTVMLALEGEGATPTMAREIWIITFDDLPV
jgi:hypothetical protein